MRGALAAAWQPTNGKASLWRVLPRAGQGTLLEEPALWQFSELAGRFCELSAQEQSAVLTLSCRLVADAQRRKERSAWVTLSGTAFYPPDAARCGVDLETLAVIFAPDPTAAAKAADVLLRSGGFGLVVLDLTGALPSLSLAALARLNGLAQQQRAVLLCLTQKSSGTASLGSLVSLRAHGTRRRMAPGRFACHAEILKDKHRGPGWSAVETAHGPSGLR